MRAGFAGVSIVKCYIDGMGKLGSEANALAVSALAEMIERGEVIPATATGSLTDAAPLPAREDGVSPADDLIAFREEERS
jgi:hypothetical protein